MTASSSSPQAPITAANPGSPTDESGPGVATTIALLRYRRVVVGAAVAAFAGVGISGLLAPRTYTASASFITQAAKAPSNIAGLAAQLGVSVQTGEAGTNPAFYLDLLRSRGVLSSVVTARFTSVDQGKIVTGTLAELLHVPGNTSAERREAAIRALRDRLSTTLTPKTGVIAFSVRTLDPELSHQIAVRLIAELNRFNLERRQSQAAAERKFAESRLGEVRAELRDAEDRMQVFLQRNREYRSAPDLIFEAERLQREIALRQQLYSALSQALEQAKIDQVRDTPVITVIEAPEAPASPDARGLVRRSLLAFGTGAFLGAFLAIVLYAVRGDRSPSGEARGELARLWLETREDFRHPHVALRSRLVRPSAPE